MCGLLCRIPGRLCLEVIDPFDVGAADVVPLARLDKVVRALEHLDDFVSVSLVDEVVLAKLFGAVLDRRAQQDYGGQGAGFLGTMVIRFFSALIFFLNILSMTNLT